MPDQTFQETCRRLRVLSIVSLAIAARMKHELLWVDARTLRDHKAGEDIANRAK
jgi:hypothetical protein